MAIGKSPGRGPRGYLRNFRAMTPEKLGAVITMLREYQRDPEALATALAARRDSARRSRSTPAKGSALANPQSQRTFDQRSLSAHKAWDTRRANGWKHPARLLEEDKRRRSQTRAKRSSFHLTPAMERLIVNLRASGWEMSAIARKFEEKGWADPFDVRVTRRHYGAIQRFVWATEGKYTGRAGRINPYTDKRFRLTPQMLVEARSW